MKLRGGGVKRDVGRDEKQLIKFAWPNLLKAQVINWNRNQEWNRTEQETKAEPNLNPNANLRFAC